MRELLRRLLFPEEFRACNHSRRAILWNLAENKTPIMVKCDQCNTSWAEPLSKHISHIKGLIKWEEHGRHGY